MNPKKQIRYVVLYALAIFSLGLFAVFIPDWWFNISSAELTKYYPKFGKIIYFYVNHGIYGHLVIVMTLPIFLIYQFRNQIIHLLPKLWKYVKINIYLFMLVIFSLTAAFDVTFFPSIVFPDFKNKYNQDKSLTVRRMRVMKGHDTLDINEIMKPYEIHNTIYIHGYLLNEKYKRNALKYLEGKMITDSIIKNR